MPRRGGTPYAVLEEQVGGLINSILVICVGNICRSPLGERLLTAKLADQEPPILVASAGIGALVGLSADPVASEVAQAHGVSLDNHVARQFTEKLGSEHTLLLVMEPKHRMHIIRHAPHLAGRVMLFDRWTGARGIGDPYGRSREFHEIIYSRIEEAATAWATRLIKQNESPE